MAPLIVFAGSTSPTAKVRMPRGEAIHYRERALELGVPSPDVLVEPNACNTGENVRLSRAVLEEAGIDVESVLCRQAVGGTPRVRRSTQAVGRGRDRERVAPMRFEETWTPSGTLSWSSACWWARSSGCSATPSRDS
ncbi:ElyC/SanA/YdcF family protein [Streptomyces sp. NBC_01187]|uniref:ElyC/SanA/YdcF family protein n=1 Tax=Streptomyces sp. NBC_01187 TaxID=2903766 RepID=UPI00386D5411